MLDKLKTLLFLSLITYYIYRFVELDYTNVPLSIVEKSLISNATSFDDIYIDESKNIAYLQLNSTYDNIKYKTSFSNHDDFRQLVRNLSGEHYKNLNISYKITNTFGDLAYNIVLSMLAINIIFSVVKMIIPSSRKQTIGDDDDDSSGMHNIFPSSSKNYFTLIEKSNVKFNEIIGLKSVKEDLYEFVKYLKFPKKYDENGCKISKGLLFVGPPGVGKTYLAKAFASESEVTFIYTTGSSFDEIYIGMGSKRIRQLFKYARQNTPCIIFIDEIDAIGSRSMTPDRRNINSTINALLAELDGMIDSEGIMVIASTNLDELLDAALTRSGRFDKRFVFDLPTLEERIQLFEMYLSKIKLDSSFNRQDDIKLLAKRTIRLTGADIKNICNQGILNHMKQYTVKETTEKNKLLYLENTSNNTGCTLKDLNDALDDIGIGNVKAQNVMTEKEKKQVAYHEAGHTLISCLVENGNVPLKVSIMPRGHSLGFTQPDTIDKHLIFRKELLANICTTLGGRAAEKIIFDDITTGAADDLKKVSEMVYKYYTDHSFGNVMYITKDKLHSDQYKYDLNNDMKKLINNCFDFVVDTLSNNINILRTLADKLLDKETLSNSDILEILPKDKIGSYKINI